MKKYLKFVVLIVGLIVSHNAFGQTTDCDIPAPASCFDVVGNNQTYNGASHCASSGTKVELSQKIIDFLGDQLYKAAPVKTDIGRLQSFLNRDEYTKEVIENNTYCKASSFEDGKYGNCTKKVLEAHIKNVCEEEKVEEVEEEVVEDVPVVVEKDEEEHIVFDADTFICPDSYNKGLKRACDDAVDGFTSSSKWIKLSNQKFFGEDFVSRESEIEGIKIKERNIKTHEILFLKGLLRMAEIQNQPDVYYSDLEKESMFITAADFFEKAGELARKPVILSGGILPGPSNEGDGTDYLVNSFLVKFVNGSLVLLFSIGTIILIIGGLMLLLSSGDSEMLTKAKDTIFWGFVGVIIAVMAYVIVKFVVGLDFGF